MNCAESCFRHPPAMLLLLVFSLVLLLGAPTRGHGESAETWEEEFSFDVEEFEKKELEWG